MLGVGYACVTPQLLQASGYTGRPIRITSLLHAVDPFSDNGLLSAIQANDQWAIHVRISRNHEVAMRTENAKPPSNGWANPTKSEGDRNVDVCANRSSDREYASLWKE
jgi:hypothetical protein